MNPPLVSLHPGEFRCLEFRQETGFRGKNAVVWLHGIGERGHELPLVAKYGLPAALLEGRVTADADVICPQLEADMEWEPSRTKELLSGLSAEYSALALIGFSLGGLGVCELLAQYGPRADVHVAIAAQTRRRVTASQTNSNFLSVSGEHDPWHAMAQYIREFQTLGGLGEQVVLPNEGHFISETALKHPKFVSALLSIGISFSWNPKED
jgi:predicted esterase